MSTRIIYTCDRCGAESDNSSQQWQVGIVAKSLNSSIHIEDLGTAQRQMHVCRNCCKDMGLAPRVKQPLPECSPPQPTLEDLIREICQTTIDEQNGL